MVFGQELNDLCSNFDSELLGLLNEAAVRQKNPESVT